MASRVGQKVKLSSIDELLGVPSTEGAVDLDILAIYFIIKPLLSSNKSTV